jgi:GNAT superfamily N-acetyltransferase
MNNYIKIEKINKEDIIEILELGDIIFKGQLNDNKTYIFYTTNWDISLKLTNKEKIIGFYLFKDINYPYQNNLFKNKKGIEGIALGVMEEYRNNGYGKYLINYSITYLSKNYDYIWGQHLNSLNNKEDWKKRRKIMKEFSNMFITAYIFNK